MPLLLQAVIAGQGTSPAEALRLQAEQMREQAEAMRVQASAMRDAANAQRDLQRARGQIIVNPRDFPYANRRREGMAFAGFIILVVAGIAVLRPVFRALARRLENAPRRDDLVATDVTDRLERIERAVEAMAIEVERISENQRFTTRLLSERAPLSLPVER